MNDKTDPGQSASACAARWRARPAPRAWSAPAAPFLDRVREIAATQFLGGTNRLKCYYAILQAIREYSALPVTDEMVLEAERRARWKYEEIERAEAAKLRRYLGENK